MAEQAGLDERIAARSGVAIADVREVFDSYGVALAHPPARPRPMRVRRLHIAGERTGAVAPGPIDSTLKFDDGLTGLVAANLRGKSSVLELITWCLRGEPKKLRKTVRRWLRQVDLDTVIADRVIGFRLNLVDGKFTSAVILAAPTLEALAQVRDADPARDVVALSRALTAESYADQVQSLMMTWMDLQPLVSTSRETSLTTNGWPAYFGAVYLPPARSDALVGDVVMGGLSGRLLQVYLDLPGAGALTRIKSEAKLLTARRKARAAADKQARSDRAEERGRIEADLDRARAVLESVSGPQHGAEVALIDLAETVRRLAGAVGDAQERWEECDSEFRQARRQRRRDEKRLNDASESATARRLFHGLDPRACPRCDQEIAADRRALEKEAHSCAVCARPVEGDDTTPEDVLDEARACLEASTKAEQAARERVRVVEAEVSRVSEQLRAAEEELRRADVAAQVPLRFHAHENVLRLEGALSVFPELPPVVENVEDVQHLKVLNAAAAVMEADHEAASAVLFRDVNEHILELGLRFGIDSLEKVSINRSAQLNVRISGVDETFTDQGPGERLRLRIAVIVALLRVGAAHQVSTHPGLLLMDSPKAEEIQDMDIRNLMRELVDVADGNGLQVLFTTTDRAMAHEMVKPENLIEAEDSKPLW